MIKFFSILLTLCLFLSPLAQAVHVVLAGGVALSSWEKLRGPEQHDKWWANFIRASTMHMGILKHKNPQAKILWIVYKPAYYARAIEDNKPYVDWIEDNAKRYGAKLVWVQTADEIYRAINQAPTAGQKVESFYYFGHSNAYAFMLDYSCGMIGVSKVWMHESDIAKRINPNIFASNALCYSYGCYTGVSMSGAWYRALGVPLWGNTQATRYQPLSSGRMPEGVGTWVSGARP